MIVSCVYVHVKPGSVKEFIEATRANHREAVREPGNLRFDFSQQSDDDTKFLLYEAYETEEASAAHKSTPHYLRWRDEVQDMMAEPRKGVKYNILSLTK